MLPTSTNQQLKELQQPLPFVPTNIQLRLHQQYQSKMLQQINLAARGYDQRFTNSMMVGSLPNSSKMQKMQQPSSALLRSANQQQNLGEYSLLPKQMVNQGTFSSEMVPRDQSSMHLQMLQLGASIGHQEYQLQQQEPRQVLNTATGQLRNIQQFQVDQPITILQGHQNRVLLNKQYHVDNPQSKQDDLPKQGSTSSSNRSLEETSYTENTPNITCPQFQYTVAGIASQQQIPSNRQQKLVVTSSLLNRDQEKSGTDQNSINLLRAAFSHGGHLPPNRVGVAGVPQPGINGQIKSPNTATPFHMNDLSTYCSQTGTHTPNVIAAQQGFSLSAAAVNKGNFGEQGPNINNVHHNYYHHQNAYSAFLAPQNNQANMLAIGSGINQQQNNFRPQINFYSGPYNSSFRPIIPYTQGQSNEEASLEKSSSSILPERKITASSLFQQVQQQYSDHHHFHPNQMRQRGVGWAAQPQDGGIPPIQQQCIIQQEQQHKESQQIQTRYLNLSTGAAQLLNIEPQENIRDESSRIEEDKNSDDEDAVFQSKEIQGGESRLLIPELECQFSSQAQKRRRTMAETLLLKQGDEILIEPAEKQHRGPQIKLHITKKRASLKEQKAAAASVSSQQLFRGSRFRGISKNGGSSWQILVMVNRQKKYLGSLQSEDKAARLYDKVVIQQQGLKAKTNFAYTGDQLAKILKLKPLV